jgi:hypothetical protein
VDAAAADTAESRAEGARALWIALSVLAASFVVLANHCAAWYNMVLFFHIGLETHVLEHAFAYAAADGTPSAGVILASVGAAIVILHLIPFLLLDAKYLLATLAWAGVGVNVALAEYISGQTVPLLLSSTALLVATLATLGGDCYQPSLASQFRMAAADGSFVRVERYTL